MNRKDPIGDSEAMRRIALYWPHKFEMEYRPYCAEEIRAWCADQFGPAATQFYQEDGSQLYRENFFNFDGDRSKIKMYFHVDHRWWVNNFEVFRFKDQVDATAFKLRWF